MLLICVDPGYDAYKIYVNGHNFMTKSLCVKVGVYDAFETDVPSVTDGAVIQMRDYNSGKVVQYLMGQDAREYLATDGAGTADVSESYADADRFSTPQFRASFYGAVVRALWQYSKIENEVGFSVEDLADLKSWKIYMMVTVPYAYAKQAKENVQTFLRTPVEARIRLSRRVSVTLDAPLNLAELAFHPQVLAAFRGMFIDDCGEYISDEAESAMKKNLPALIIDAGYHTCAIVSFSKLLTISEGNAVDANGNAIETETFSMEQFDIETAKRIRQQYTSDRIPDADLEPTLINEYCSGDRDLYASDVTSELGGNEKVDVTRLRALVLNGEKEKLVRYLNRKFSMGKMVSAYITGGTGESVMYDYLSDVLKNWKNIQNVALIQGKDFNRENVGSVYGVAYGGYVLLAAIVRSSLADDE